MVFLLRFLLASSRCASLVLQLFPLSQLYSILLLTLLPLKDEEDRKADGNESLTVIFFLIDWFHFFWGSFDQGEKLLGSLGGIFSKSWKPKKTKKITGPMVRQGTHTHSFYLSLTQKLSLSFSTFPGSNIFLDMAKQ
jgi:hypothetical protein